MNNIFILDGQTDEVLGHINKKYIIENEHEKDLPSHKDYFRFTVLADNKHAEHLTKRNGLIIPGEDGELLEFRIFESIKYRNSEGLFVEVHALATYLDLKNQKIFDPQKTSSETALQHAITALDGTEWQVGNVEFKGVRTLDFDSPFNSYDYILRIAREFELEPSFYVETDGNKITGRYVDLIERIGEYRGRTIEFGRDLQSIERKEDTSEVVTALWVYGPEKEDGTRLKVLVEDDEARQRWGRRGQHIIDYYEPETENQDITEERLRTLGEMELRKRINTVVTYEAEILDLENVPGLENKRIRFGDTIRIKDTKFNPPLYVEARVFNVKRDVFNKANKTVQLGDYREYTEEEVKELFRQMQAEIRRRLERLVLVSIISSAGNVFKNGEGSTALTAKTFLSGTEVDEDGTKYEYRWHKFDKNGDYDAGFYEEGKTITVNAIDIDEKATFRVEIILDDEVLTLHEITLTNVFDGEDGEPGPPGPKGDKGDKGDPGPQGPPGTSITSIVEYYLATDQSSGVTIDTPGWTTTMQQMTPQNRYLWNYERINFSDDTYQNTNPVIIGVYGDEGEEGRSVVNITEYYLATSASSGVTRSTPGWTTTMQVTTPEEKYLWNYEKITWNKAPFETYTDPVIIGVHGEQGPKGDKGEDGQSVEDITIEYYLSDSDSTQIGGTWTETKPTYQPGKYLWIRQKITYKNPTAIEYTTPVLDDSWKAIEIADEAKQEAQNAMSTADGKNTVFRQSSTPPTTGRKIGDLWFKTDEGNKMFVWTGSAWTETKFDYQALSVGQLSAISADLGNVTAGHISGVTIEGGSIKSNTTIDVTTDLKVGDHIVIGEPGIEIEKHIDFNLQQGEQAKIRGITDEYGFVYLDIINTNIIRLLDAISLYTNINFFDVPDGFTFRTVNNPNGVLTVNENIIDSIVEQGTNANGNYIRYDNGIQICWHNQSFTSNASGNLSYEWTLPASFINTQYYANAIVVSSGYHNNGFTLQRTTTMAHLRGSGVLGNTNYTAALFAIGRWK